MKRTKQRQKTIVGLMHDPEPKFVALVKHGANQRPFHAVKATQKEAPMPGNSQKSKGATTAVKVHRIVFDPAHFATIEAVTDYLTGKGYSDFEVKALEAGGFEVIDTPVEEIDGDLRTVESTSTKGVVYHVGNPKQTAKADADGEGSGQASGDDAAQDDPADKAASAGQEGTAKGDDAPGKMDAGPEAKPDDDAGGTARKRVRKGAAMSVNGASVNAFIGQCEAFAAFADERGVTVKTFAETVSEYTGGTPPGMWVLTDALMTELRKMFKTGKADETRVSALTTEFARGVLAVHAAFASIMDGMDTATKSADPADDAAIEAFLNMVFGAPGAVSEDKPDASTAKLTAMEGTINAMAASMAAMQKTIDALAVMAAETQASTTKTVEQPTPRIVAGRKSEDAADTEVEGAEPDEEERREMERRTLKRLGFAR